MELAPWKVGMNEKFGYPRFWHLRKVPWDAVVLVLSLLYPTFKPAVGEGVAFVEVQVALISEEAVPSTGLDIPEVVGGDQVSGEVDEMFSSRLKLYAMLSHHWELLRGADEDAESTVTLIMSAKGHRVGVKVQC